MSFDLMFFVLDVPITRFVVPWGKGQTVERHIAERQFAKTQFDERDRQFAEFFSANCPFEFAEFCRDNLPKTRRSQIIMFLAVGYAPISASARRPLGAANVPILLSEVEQEQRPSGDGDRKAIVVEAGLCDGEVERAYTVEVEEVVNDAFLTLKAFKIGMSLIVLGKCHMKGSI